MLPGSALLHLCMVWLWHAKHSVGTEKAELHEHNKQETNELYLQDFLLDWQNQTFHLEKPLYYTKAERGV